MSYRASRRADSDLHDIWQFIARDSVNAADRVEQELHEAMEMLARMPTAGHLRSDLDKKPYRVWSVYSYLIVYRPLRKGIVVVRVVHGARNMKKLFRGKS